MFEPRWVNVVVWVIVRVCSVVLRRTVVGVDWRFDNLSNYSKLLQNKQNKENDDFELYVTKDRFYKAYGTLPTKTPTDFDKYVTAA